MVVVVVVDTTAAVGGGAAVVTTRVASRLFLLLIPIPIQQLTHNAGIRIGKHVHIRERITAPAIIPANEEATHMIT